MELERKQDLAIYHWARDTVFENAPHITITDGYPEGNLVLPTVSVDAIRIDLRQYELGNRSNIRFRRWFLDIFAKNKSQRDEIGYRLLNYLEDNIKVYNYDEGFPPDQNPSEIGVLIPQDWRMEFIRVVPELVDTLYWRATVSFNAIYQSN